MPKKGGKLQAKEVKDFLNASYDKTPPTELDGYILDKSLSTDTAKVYYNPQTNHAVVAHRGTQGIMDWGNNLAYAVGAYNLTSRYKQGKSVQDKAEKKYGKQNISTLGHSQGAVLARKLGSDTKEVINVNPAYTGERPKKNEYNIRSSTDVVSGLYAPVAKTRELLFPKYSEKHDITVPSQSATDVLGEHSYNILDRLGDKEIGVGAGNKISTNSIMKGGRTKRLGYSFDDIDWLGTNNNCGAVGTPYVNKGKNPIAVIGGAREEGYSEEKSYSPEEEGEASSSDEEGLTEREVMDFIDRVRNVNERLHLPQIPQLLGHLEDLLGFIDNEMVAEDIRDVMDAIEQDIEDAGGDPGYEETKSDSDEEVAPPSDSDEEMEGGKIKKISLKKVGKAFQKGITDVGSAFGKAGDTLNPMSYAIKDKGTRDAMVSSGEVTHDYLLPAVVSAGKPIYDATAVTASTMLTGNPVLGKAVADTMWNQMVAKPGYDPRQNQKSQELGELSSTFGQAVSKPYSLALAGKGRYKGGKFDIRHDIESAKRKAEKEAERARYFATRPPSPPPAPVTVPIEDIPELAGWATGRGRGGMRRFRDYRIEATERRRDLTKDLLDKARENRDRLDIQIGRRLNQKNPADDDQKILDNLMRHQSNVMENVSHLENLYNQQRDEAERSLNLVKNLDRSKYVKGFSTPEGRILYGEGRGGTRTIWEKLYDIINPADDFDTWKERQKGRRITKARRAKIEAEYQALLMRQKADALEREAKAKEEQEIAIANQIGEFEKISPEEAERATMEQEDKGSKHLGTESKIEKEDPEWAMEGKGRGGALTPLQQDAVLLGIPFALMTYAYATGGLQNLIDWWRGNNAVAPEPVGQQEEFKEEMDEEEGAGRVDFEDVKWGTFTRMFKQFKKENPRARVKDLEAFAHRIIKNKKKFSDKAFKKAQFYLNVLKKGGASVAQIGKANEMRTYSRPGNTTYYALSDLTHSADKPGSNQNPSVVFRNLDTTQPDPRAEAMLESMMPSYLNQKYRTIEELMARGEIDPAQGDYLLRWILGKDPNADKQIKGYNDNWGITNPLTKRIYKEIEATNPKAMLARQRKMAQQQYQQQYY